MGKSSGINLLRGRGKSFVDNFIDWALSIGRVVIIITELIAMGVFLSRFFYDSQLTDLHTSIKQKQQIVTFLANDEVQDRNLQNRLKNATTLSADSSKKVTIIKALYNSAHQGIVINTITLNDNTAQIDATAFSISALSSFTAALKTNPLIATVSVDKVENKIADGTIAITISTVLKGNGASL